MNKSVILAIVALGGLILIGVSLKKDDSQKDILKDQTQIDTKSIPSDISMIPVYPGAQVLNTNDVQGEESRDISLSLGVKASISDINDWYRKSLSENGWSIKSDKNIAGYQIIQGENNNFYTSIQAANGDDLGFARISQQIKIRK